MCLIYVCELLMVYTTKKEDKFGDGESVFALLSAVKTQDLLPASIAV